MIRLVKPVSDGGAPYINPDFVNTLQNNHITSFSSFYDTINDQTTGNCGIIIRGIKNVTIPPQNIPDTDPLIPPSKLDIDFRDSVVYLEEEILKPDDYLSSVPSYEITGGVFYIVKKFKSDEKRVNKVYNTEIVVLEENVFDIIFSDPSPRKHIKVEIDSWNRNLCTRYLSRLMKYYTSEFGETYPYVGPPNWNKIAPVDSTNGETWFDSQGKGFGPMYGFALCDGNNGTTNLKNRFLIGQDLSQTDLPFNNNDIQTSYIIKNYSKIGNVGGFSQVQLLKRNIRYHTHGFDNPQSINFTPKNQKYTTYATNDLSHIHEVTVGEWPKSPYEGSHTNMNNGKDATGQNPFDWQPNNIFHSQGAYIPGVLDINEDFGILDSFKNMNLGIFGPSVAARMPKPADQAEVNTLFFGRNYSWPLTYGQVKTVGDGVLNAQLETLTKSQKPDIRGGQYSQFQFYVKKDPTSIAQMGAMPIDTSKPKQYRSLLDHVVTNFKPRKLFVDTNIQGTYEGRYPATYPGVTPMANLGKKWSAPVGSIPTITVDSSIGTLTNFWEQRPLQVIPQGAVALDEPIPQTGVYYPKNFKGINVYKYPATDVLNQNPPAEIYENGHRMFLARTGDNPYRYTKTFERQHLWDHKHKLPNDVNSNVPGNDPHPNVPPHYGVVYYEKINPYQ